MCFVFRFSAIFQRFCSPFVLWFKKSTSVHLMTNLRPFFVRADPDAYNELTFFWKEKTR